MTCIEKDFDAGTGVWYLIIGTRRSGPRQVSGPYSTVGIGTGHLVGFKVHEEGFGGHADDLLKVVAVIFTDEETVEERKTGSLEVEERN